MSFGLLPFSRPGEDVSVQGEVSSVGTQMALQYHVSGGLRPAWAKAPYVSGRRDQHFCKEGLWNSTCFEAFFRKPGNEAYCEWNASPQGFWNTYSFTRYRQKGDGFIRPESVHLDVLSDGLRLEFDIPKGWRGSEIEFGLSAVLDFGEQGLSYWALRHCSDQPDFHHPDSFIGRVSL